MDTRAEKPVVKDFTQTKMSNLKEENAVKIIDVDVVRSAKKVVSGDVTDNSAAVDTEKSHYTNVNAFSQDDGKCILDIVDNGTENAQSNTVLVNATAALKNCPNSTDDDVTVNAILEVISSNGHVQRNLKAISVGNIRNRPMWRGSTKFMHEVEISLEVIKSNLWEPVRSFIWKNIGTSSWTLPDGTQLAFFSIHQN